MNRDYEILKTDLADIGLQKGDSVLIHSSYKSMGGLEGGIQTLVDAAMAVIGDSGTLIVPTLTYKYVTEDAPVFDYLNTPSCVGAVSEYIRLMPGAKRSIHPTHSCAAFGAMRDFYLQGHENDRTPVGENSPLRRLMQNGGKVLMLGCFVGYNTCMHGVEEEFGAPYLLRPTPSKYTVILPDRRYEIDYRRHHILQNGYAQRYDRLANVIDPEYMKKGSIHGAQSYLIDGAQMRKAGLAALKEDPYFFVERMA